MIGIVIVIVNLIIEIEVIWKVVMAKSKILL